MYIVIAAATETEINTTLEWIRKEAGTINGHEIEVLITGIGSTAAAYALTRQIQLRTPELIVQAGIGGSFNDDYAPGSVVLIKEEVFADLGAYGDYGFHDIFDLGLAASDEKPYTHRTLVNPHIGKWEKSGLPSVRGATINCISSTNLQVRAIKSKYNPDVESMEGAALHYTCIMEDVPFLQLRSVSNYAGERNKENWKMKEAIEVLNSKLRTMLIFDLLTTSKK